MTPEAQTRQRMGRERERELARLATQQHGVVSRRQLLALGFGDEAIKTRLDAMRLQALHREVFAVGHSRLGEAARRWGAVIDVTAARGRQGIHRREGIFIHRGRLHPEDRAVRGGLPVTTVARTLFDLAEFTSQKRLESAWEEADRLSLLQLTAVEDVCERGHGRRALKPIRRLLAEARAAQITRSPLEDEFAAFCRAHDLPTPSFNTTVLGFEVDALWPRERLAAELDSWEFHRHRAAFERDRARDSALQAAGYRTIRITHRRLQQEAFTVASEIRRLLARAAG